jgi:pyruvate kinase
VPQWDVSSPRTKIVGTLGPASSGPEVIRSLVEAGLDVARINFSHGTHDEHARTIAAVRTIAAELGRPVAIMGDLQGPRIRLGALRKALDVQDGEELTFAHETDARRDDVPVTYERIAADVQVGGRILVNDGLLEFVVTGIEGKRVHVHTVHGGAMTSHKGMNLPGIDVSAPSLTEKDLADIALAKEQDLDYLALSFVRRADDMHRLRSLLPRGMLVIAKIEKDSALTRIEEILQGSDAVMVARGDLGVELPFEEVPLAQKRIIGLANRYGRPVITATQMLESMIEHPRPTRAEANDVANAVLDGTDAVMLSAETAAGAYPVLAVEAMRRIIVAAETLPVSRGTGIDRLQPGDGSTEETIASASVTAVRVLNAPLVIVFTKSGFSARIVAARRPGVPIVVLTDQRRTYRQLALVWGVVPFLVPHADTYEAMAATAKRVLLEQGLAKAGDRVVVTAGVPFDVPGTTNMLKVESV